MLEVAGSDATSAFEDVGHSQDAREILRSFLIGVLEGAPREKATEEPSKALPSVQVIKKSDFEDGDKTRGLFTKARMELSGFSIGTAILVWILSRFHLLENLHGGQGSFTQGFLLAVITAGAIGLAAIRYLQQLISSPEFLSYSAHMPSSTKRRASYHPAGVLVPQEYQGFSLRDKTELANGIWRFTFNLPTKYSMLGLPIGQHVAIKADIEDNTVVRSYTPVSNNRDLGRMELLIRVYPQGKMGNYLKNLRVGNVAEIRGPKGAMRYRKGTIKSIGMVAGGTGITPMFQIIRAICEDDTDETMASLIYANRSETDIMLRAELEHFAQVAARKFKLFYVLDEPPPAWKGGTGHVTKDLLAERLRRPSEDTQVLLCGPPPMVDAMKKNLVALGFKQPGAVSKMTDQIFCF